MTEQQQYAMVRSLGRAELRRYRPHVVAEVSVDASFADAGSRAFRRLAAYLGGSNGSASEVAMTAPVTQTASRSSSAKGMRAPLQHAEPGAYVVAFVLPAGLTPQTAPEPTDPSVRLRAVDEQLAAALRYSGRWTKASFDRHLTALEREVRAAWLAPAGPPVFARFNPPIVPWFLRRNEVVLPVAEVPEA